MRLGVWRALVMAGALVTGSATLAAQTPVPAALKHRVLQLQKQVNSQRADRDQLDRQVRELKQDSDRAAAESEAKDRQIHALQAQLQALHTGQPNRTGAGGS